jgi:hypothetical protein
MNEIGVCASEMNQLQLDGDQSTMVMELVDSIPQLEVSVVWKNREDREDPEHGLVARRSDSQW